MRTRPRLRARQGIYRGDQGWFVSGSDLRGRRVRVFTPSDPATVKANITAGLGPFEGMTFR